MTEDNKGVVAPTQEETGDEEAEMLVNVPEDPQPHHGHVKDYETGLSFTMHGSPLTKDVTSSVTNTANKCKIPDRYRLVAEEDALNWSMYALRFAVLATACGQTVLQPNFPFLVIPGYTKYSFPSTDPFDFSAANYFLPLTTLLATAITSAFVGSLSDRIGRRPCVLVCMGCMVVTCIGQYFAQDTFWGFCAASFVNGLFCVALPIGMAYASDVHPNRVKKDEEIGFLVGANMLGMSGGGVIAILMEDQNLFAPALVAAGIDFISFVMCFLFLIEPDTRFHFEEESDEAEGDGPERIDYKLFVNVIFGALLDNIGSTGLYPLCLAPLAFNNFLVELQPDPIMSETAYKWLFVCVALMVIPGAALSQPVFAKIGAAGGCVMGNAITAVGIVACMYIAEIKPATSASFAGFIVCLYLVFPLTVISQLSTGPMLDMLAPHDQRGFAQGMNMTVMNFAFAVSPWFLGIMSDNLGIVATLWFCVGVSILAAVVNSPLMFAAELKRKAPLDYQQAMGLEDQDLVDRALAGEWVPARFLADLNYSRLNKGLPFLQIPVRTYEEDKKQIKIIQRHAKTDFEYLRFVMHDLLSDMQDPEKKQHNLETINKTRPSEEKRKEAAEAMGRWFSDYLYDSGYFIEGGWPPVYKQMILHSFPLITSEKDLTLDNMEPIMVRYLANMNRILREDEPSRAIRGFRNSVVV